MYMLRNYAHTSGFNAARRASLPHGCATQSVSPTKTQHPTLLVTPFGRPSWPRCRASKDAAPALTCLQRRGPQSLYCAAPASCRGAQSLLVVHHLSSTCPAPSTRAGLHTAAARLVPAGSSQEEEQELVGTVPAANMAAILDPSQGFQLVVAATPSGGIGNAGGLPAWKLPGDMAYFKELTSRTRDSGRQNAVIMGRKTWESVPQKFRPLKGRINIVLSRGFGGADGEDAENSSAAANRAAPPSSKSAAPLLPEGVHAADSLSSALDLLQSDGLRGRVEGVYIIGGGQVYKEALAHPNCAAVHVTRVEREFECDTFLPTLDPAKFRVWSASPPMVEHDTRWGAARWGQEGGAAAAVGGDACARMHGSVCYGAACGMWHATHRGTWHTSGAPAMRSLFPLRFVRVHVCPPPPTHTHNPHHHQGHTHSYMYPSSASGAHTLDAAARRYSFVTYTRCDVDQPVPMPVCIASRHDELQVGPPGKRERRGASAQCTPAGGHLGVQARPLSTQPRF